MTYQYNLALRFREVAAAHAENCAIACQDGLQVTYHELDILSNRIARVLAVHGVVKADVVAIINDKSPAALAVMLACLKLGAIYTNLDPDSPYERIRRILETSRPRLIVNAFEVLSLAEKIADDGAMEMMHLNSSEIKERIQAEHIGPLSVAEGITGADPAYIMFTSGSTGYPKGAVMSHGNLLNFIEWASERFTVTPHDRFTNVNPIYFDNSVFDFYASLFNGATMVPISSAIAREPRKLVRAVNESECTIWFSVPSLLVYLLTSRALSHDDLPEARKIIFGGEGFPKSKLKQLFDLYAHRKDLENVYGPTECTCICSAHTVSADDFNDMQNLAPLGDVAPNFSYEILPQGDDPDFGELFLKGPNVGLGYYGDPERTAMSFRQNPLQEKYHEVGYRTGDLVRRDQKGQLHFKGRVDFQIKHMGYRIELEEIEAALNSVAGINEAAAVYEKLGEGLGQILAFVSLEQARRERDLLGEVAQKIPSYMVPKRITVLDVLPKNQNGKIDRVALQRNLVT